MFFFFMRNNKVTSFEVRWQEDDKGPEGTALRTVDMTAKQPSCWVYVQLYKLCPDYVLACEVGTYGFSDLLCDGLNQLAWETQLFGEVLEG